jgi:transcription initiation factor TFIIIB Brf1 subunit/transcription initiation factor TFIIB
VHDRKALKGRALKSVYAVCIYCALQDTLLFCRPLLQQVHDRKALKRRALKSVYAACIYCVLQDTPLFCRPLL